MKVCREEDKGTKNNTWASPRDASRRVNICKRIFDRDRVVSVCLAFGRLWEARRLGAPVEQVVLARRGSNAAISPLPTLQQCT